MKINVINNNKKYIINVNKYVSINSILYHFYDNTDDYYIDYNGIYLDKNYSLDKYNIEDDSTITINKKVRGGKSNFFNFVKKNWLLSIFILLIVLLPCILLPIGYIIIPYPDAVDKCAIACVVEGVVTFAQPIIVKSPVPNAKSAESLTVTFVYDAPVNLPLPAPSFFVVDNATP